ncbi:MAG: Kelch repeat-containing protein [Candidatus Saccharibacteria bacterium]
MKTPKIKTPILLLTALTIVMLFVFTFWTGLFAQKKALAVTNSTVNFQARLMTASGTIVPDGNYNVEFKLYNALTSSGSSQGSCTGDAACLWTETRTSGNQVHVVNGYLTANLGGVTAFPTTINWDQNLYLTMNIGGTSGTPSWDGEMAPRLKLTATPYAFRAGQLATNNGTFSSTLSFTNPTANDSILLPDASGTICLQSSASCGFALSSGSGSYIQNGTSLQAANFNVQAATSGTVAATLQANASGTADILDLKNGSGTPVATFGSAGAVLLKNSTNSTAAFQIQNASGLPVLSADTTNGTITIGNVTTTSGQNLAGKLLFADGTLDGFSATVNVSTLTANRVISLPDSGGTLCLQSSASCGFAPTSGSANYIQNTTSVQAANEYIQNAGATTADTAIFRFSSGQTGDAIKVLNSAGTANVWEVQPSLVTQTVPLKLNPGTLTTFTTPAGSSVSTAINIPLMDPGAFGQILAFGLPATAATTARSISVFDARTASGLQPSIALFNRSEGDAFGLSWNGSTTIASLETLSGNIALRPGGTNTQLYAVAGGDVGIGTNFLSPNYPLDVQGDVNTSTQYRISGTVICTTSGCTAASGSGFYIQNGTGIQSANFDVQAATSGSVAAVLQANAAGTGDILDLKNGSGTPVATFGSAGAALFKNSTNTTAGFQIQNAAGTSNLLVADTTNTRIAIAQATATYTLDVAGDINSTTALRVAGTSVCDTVGSTGCIAKSGSGYYIHNQTTVQSANLYVQAATSGTVAATLQANAAGTGDILDLKNGAGTAVATFGSTGAVSMQNSTNSTSALAVQTSSGGSVLNVDTTNNIVSQGGGTQDSMLPWTATNVAAAPLTTQASASYNGYLYSFGGYNGSATVATSYYVAQNANGTLGTWATTTALPVALDIESAVAYNGYMYVLGGQNNSGTSVSTVYYTTINAVNGTLGAWSTTTALTKAVGGHTAVAMGGYMYIMGGLTGTGVIANTYYATISAVNGTLGAWTSTTAVPSTVEDATSVAYNGYVYVMGGANNAGTGLNTVYFAKPNTGTGAIASWSTTTALPATLTGAASAVSSTGQVYVVGGYNGSVDTLATYTGQFNASTGAVASWSATTDYVATVEYPGVALSNGYLYIMGGFVNGLLTSAVNYAPVNNTGVAVAGSTTIAGNLNVHNQVTFQSTLNSTTAFEVQGSSSGVALNVDTINTRVGIGTIAPTEALSVQGNLNIADNVTSPTKQFRLRTSGSGLDLEGGGADLYVSSWTGASFTGTQQTFLRGYIGTSASSYNNPGLFVGNASPASNPMVLVVAEKSTGSGSADPSTTNFNGAMYYNDSLAAFRCYENGEWRNCVSSVQSNGINNAATAGTTTSTSYVNYPGTSSLTFTKLANSTKLSVSISVSFWSTAVNTSAKVGVLIGGTDYDCTNFYFNNAALHMPLSCTVVISGVSSGSQTAQIRWKRTVGTGGTGTLQMDTNDWITMKVEETN